MLNPNKKSTEWDITLENKTFNDLMNRKPLYDASTLIEQEINDKIKTAEVKTTDISTLKLNGNFFIETAMRYKGQKNFYPSGIKVTKSDTYILTILKEDGTLFPISLIVNTDWLKDKIADGLRTGLITEVFTGPLKTTQDVNMGYLINITDMLRDILILNTATKHTFLNEQIGNEIRESNEKSKIEALQRITEIRKKKGGPKSS